MRPLTRLPSPLRPSLLPRLLPLPAQTRHLSDVRNPPLGNPPSTNRQPPSPPAEEAPTLRTNTTPASFLGTTKRLPEFNLHDRVILVTGAARGLGLTQAEALLEAGATVYALDRLADPAPEFATIQRRAADELGTTLHYRQIDVRDVPDLNRIVREISDAEGRMDGLLAAAGIQQETAALEYSQKDANTMFEINVVGVLMTAQAVAKECIRHGRGGSMCFIASMSGSVANKGLICPVYNSSKAAVVQLGKNLAAEWGPYGIRVNTISPGYIVTKMVEALFEQYPERKETWPTQNMLGRLSGPREYRGAAVYMLSDASSFMTGTDVKIDGGHTAW
ncbi:hypothetical protein BDZ85DRAFT_112553 [Elsinoe ampelina]|uniref:Short chain dehydrogenase n=1 Tax=Elsinoe ampelina TaxID=302913 RepID=A0A6A6GD96_9PEZI|nr:hypothetical protein BDZ85DRAFT_112553 [Elsinoe ampelina]